MKLPEYKNDGPLYTSKSNSNFDDVKFPAMFFGFPVLAIVCVAIFLFALFY